MKLILAILLCPLVLFGREYSATVTGCHDGDTISVVIDLGLGVSKKESIRINGIDAPELPTAAGKASKDALIKLIMFKTITVVTDRDKKEKYGRLLANIFIEETDVSEWMIKNGFAKEYHGGKRVPETDPNPTEK